MSRLQCPYYDISAFYNASHSVLSARSNIRIKYAWGHSRTYFWKKICFYSTVVSEPDVLVKSREVDSRMRTNIYVIDICICLELGCLYVSYVSSKKKYLKYYICYLVPVLEALFSLRLDGVILKMNYVNIISKSIIFVS